MNCRCACTSNDRCVTIQQLIYNHLKGLDIVYIIVVQVKGENRERWVSIVEHPKDMHNIVILRVRWIYGEMIWFRRSEQPTAFLLIS